MFFCRPHTKSPSSGERRVACEKRLKSSQSEVAESLLSTKKHSVCYFDSRALIFIHNNLFLSFFFELYHLYSYVNTKIII